MKCPFCGYEFAEMEAQKKCSACSLGQGCRRACCPRCGYEVPLEPEWIKRLISWRKKK